MTRAIATLGLSHFFSFYNLCNIGSSRIDEAKGEDSISTKHAAEEYLFGMQFHVVNSVSEVDIPACLPR